jgi:ethanolamine utilization microcompartment shell protein EutS
MTSYRDALESLNAGILDLNQAYKAANTMEAKDSIFSVMEILQDEVNSIAMAGLAQSDAAYVAQSVAFKQASNQIAAFQVHIDKYVGYITLAGQVAQSLGKVISLLS